MSVSSHSKVNWTEINERIYLEREQHESDVSLSPAKVIVYNIYFKEGTK